MKIDKAVIERLRITEVDRLDPITVFLEDFGPAKGKITIECYGESWSSSWGGMGKNSIGQFFVQCDNGYLAQNLAPGTDSMVFDKMGMEDHLKKNVIEQRREKNIDKEKAREHWDDIGWADYDEVHRLGCENDALVERILGDDWWHDLPQTSNHKYEYLCRIIDAVRDALKLYLK